MGKVPGKKRAVKRAKPAKGPRLSRSEIAKRGWETRRANAAKLAAAHEKRAEATKKSWQKRRSDKFLAEGLHEASARTYADLTAKQLRWLHDRRLYVFGPIAYGEQSTGRDLGGRQALIDMIDANDEKWTVFRDWCLAAGYSPRQARTAFFSPSPQIMLTSSTPDIKP